MYLAGFFNLFTNQRSCFCVVCTRTMAEFLDFRCIKICVNTQLQTKKVKVLQTYKIFSIRLIFASFKYSFLNY